MFRLECNHHQTQYTSMYIRLSITMLISVTAIQQNEIHFKHFNSFLINARQDLCDIIYYTTEGTHKRHCHLDQDLLKSYYI